MGKSAEARKQYELVEYIGKLSALNKALYNRELAYFYADHDIKPKEGLELAQRELDYRRDIYAYDVMAWNLYKNGKAEEAGEAINNALRLGTKDAKLFLPCRNDLSPAWGQAEGAEVSQERIRDQSAFSYSVC